MAVSSHLHASVRFISEERSSVPTEQETVWAPTKKYKPLKTAQRGNMAERDQTQKYRSYL
jgi:hypothetical protein